MGRLLTDDNKCASNSSPSYHVNESFEITNRTWLLCVKAGVFKTYTPRTSKDVFSERYETHHIAYVSLLKLSTF